MRRIILRTFTAGLVAAGTVVIPTGTASAACYPITTKCSQFVVTRPGAQITVIGNDWGDDTEVDINKPPSGRSDRAPETVLTVTAAVGPDGALVADLPADFEPGDYVLAIRSTDASGVTRVEERGLEVRPLAASDADVASEAPAPVSVEDGASDVEVLADAPLGATPVGNGDAIAVLLGGTAALGAMRLRRRITN